MKRASKLQEKRLNNKLEEMQKKFLDQLTDIGHNTDNVKTLQNNMEN
jgi:hypothetical protein